MKHPARLAALLALAVAAVASPAQAQRVGVFFGGGATLPMGDYNDSAKLGWMGGGGLTVDLGTSGAWLEADGFFGTNKHDDTAGGKTNIFAGMAAIGYGFTRDTKVTPYVLGGAGFLSHQFKPLTGSSDTETKFGYTAAAGLSFSIGTSGNFWVEGRYLGSSGTNLVPLMAGFTFFLNKAK